MKTKVKTIWGAGLVSVNQKYVDKALGLKEGLEIEYKENIMTVPNEDLKKKKPRSNVFTDKFGRKGKAYFLYDFFWKADGKNN